MPSTMVMIKPILSPPPTGIKNEALPKIARAYIGLITFDIAWSYFLTNVTLIWEITHPSDGFRLYKATTYKDKV